MSTPNMYPIVTSNDRAEILALLHARPQGHRKTSGESPVELESEHLTIKMMNNLAVCQGFLRLSGRGNGFHAGGQFAMRETIHFERTANGWRIAREHASAPFRIDPGSSSAIAAGSRLRIDWAPRGTALQSCQHAVK